MVFLKFHAEFHMDGLQWGIRTWMMRTDASTWEGLGGFGGFLKKWGPPHTAAQVVTLHALPTVF
jgi:hypothetical protein